MKTVWKKTIAVLLSVLLFTGGVLAAEEGGGTPMEELGGEKVEIGFRLGSDELKINGKEVKVEKPFETNGTTLVPLRVITEAFGSQVEWNEEEQSILLTYGEIQLKLWIGKKEALVSGTKTQINEAPVLKNDMTMVPIRFISENFGADVGYDEKDESVTVTKIIANPNSIKDFGLILKKSDKAYTGDSYYGWKMKMPKSFSLRERSFNGNKTYFASQDEKEIIELFIDVLYEGETLDLLEDNYMNKIMKDYTLQDRQIKQLGDVEQLCLTFKKGDLITQQRFCVTDQYLYTLFYLAEDVKLYNNHKDEINELLDSFVLNYKGNDSQVEDLCGINADGLVDYVDKDYGYRLGVLPGWTKRQKEEYNIEFNNESIKPEDPQTFFQIIVTSQEEGMTAKKWAEKEIEGYQREYNSKYMTLSDIRNYEDKNGLWTTFQFKAENPELSFHVVHLYLIKDGYKYCVQYGMIQNTKEKKAEFEPAQFEKMLKSLQLDKPDAEKIGYIVDKSLLAKKDPEIKEVKGDHNWTMQMPADFIKIKTVSSEMEMFYNEDANMNVSIQVIDNTEGEKMEDVVASYWDTIIVPNRKIGKFRDCKKEDGFWVDQTKFYNLRFVQVGDGSELSYSNEIYLTARKGRVAIILVSTPEMSYSDKRVKMVSEMIASFKML